MVLYYCDGRLGSAATVIGETGEAIKLLMSDGSKQVQLCFVLGGAVVKECEGGGGAKR